MESAKGSKNNSHKHIASLHMVSTVVVYIAEKVHYPLPYARSSGSKPVPIISGHRVDMVPILRLHLLA